MIRLLGILMVIGLVVSIVGCVREIPTGPSEEITEGPRGQTLEVETEKWDNGNIKAEFQYYLDGNKIVIHGYYKVFNRAGNMTIERTYDNGRCIWNCP